MNNHRYFGLNSWAKIYVASAVGKTLIGVIRRRLTALSRNEPIVEMLYAYTMPDGTIYSEFVQGSEWTSGLNYLVALKDESGEMVTKSLWSQVEYDNMKAISTQLETGPILPIV